MAANVSSKSSKTDLIWGWTLLLAILLACCTVAFGVGVKVGNVATLESLSSGGY